MEFHLLITQFFTSSTASIFALLLFLYCLLRWKNSLSNGNNYPPQPSGAWPVIGHLHLLGDLPHITLGKLADKYGPIFTIKLGVNKALVVSSHQMAKECLGTHDRVFVDRPQTIFVQRLAYNSAMMGFSRYNQYWREMRKITAVELLSNQRVDMFKHVRISEIRSVMKELYDSYCVRKNSEAADMRQWFNDINLNSMVRMIAGKSLKDFYQGQEYVRISKALRDFFELAGTFVPADALPVLRLFDIGGYEKAMKKVAKEIDLVAQGWLDEHKRRRGSDDAKGKKQDFIDVMLEIFESGKNVPTRFDADTITKATSMTMILGATDTTAVTLTWALSLLLNNKQAIEKAQAELDTHVGKERQVDEPDLKNLTYLEAILKETLRLYPAGPLSVPREAIEDCTVSGYHIPAGTQLFVNLYKIHRDPEVWQNPLEFRPERFLTTHKDYDVRGTNFGYQPFGSGRRICPGIYFAMQSMMLTLATFLHEFDVSTPSDQPVDMTEGFGLTNLKATPLQVVFTPRLSDHLYK